MKHTRKSDIFVIGFALFSMFFGAGNVIFPPYLGLESGAQWVLGFICYYIADIGLALVALFAILHRGGSEGITRRIGRIPSTLLMCAIVLCIGPMLAIPRTAATTYETSLAPLVSGFSPALFSILFFLLILLLCVRETAVVDIVGKILTPALLIGLLILIVVGVVNPIGPVGEQPLVENVAATGVEAGYQTMDVLAAIVFGYIILKSAREKGHTTPGAQLRVVSGASLVAGIGLLAFNLLFGVEKFGARNWIQLGGVSFQPSELVKLAFILAGAATLDRLFAKRNLIFTVLFSAYCVGCLALMSDFGTALVFFVAFLCIAFLRTGDLASIVMMTAAAAFAGGLVLHFKPYVAQRFTVWRHAWEFTQTTGYQQSRTMSAIASGGLFGTGPQDGWLKHLGAANTDLVFGVVGEEFGLLPALCMAAVPVIFVVFTVRAAANARSAFYTIASSAAAAMLITQTLLNVLGSVDLLPLTGVTFPFVSNGGSAMMSAWGLLAYLKATDTRENASFAIRRGPQRQITAEARRRAEPIGDPFGQEEEADHEKD